MCARVTSPLAHPATCACFFAGAAPIIDGAPPWVCLAPYLQSGQRCCDSSGGTCTSDYACREPFWVFWGYFRGVNGM